MGLKENSILNSNIAVLRASSNAQAIEQIEEFYFAGKFNEALKFIENVIEHQTQVIDSQSFFILSARVALALNKIKLAEDYLKQAALFNIRSGSFLQMQALVFAINLYKDGCYEDAKKILSELAEANPGCELTHFFMGYYLFWSNNEPKLAIQHLARATALHPHFTLAWKIQILALEKTGATDEAQQCFEVFLKLPERETGAFISNRLM